MAYFLQNKYTKWYENIIKTAKPRQLLGYKERHHIIPKSLGGDNSASNLVALTAREHFVCHLLLTKMVADPRQLTSVRFALAKFRQYNAKQERTILNSWEFEQVRRAHSLAAKAHQTGRKMPPMSKEHREKISMALKGKPSPLRGRVGSAAGRSLSAEHKKKISEALLGKKMDLSILESKRRSDHCRVYRQDRTGAVLSEETKKKISVSNLGKIAHNKGKPAERLECPHCHKLVGGYSNFYRWHNDNCKLKSG